MIEDLTITTGASFRMKALAAGYAYALSILDLNQTSACQVLCICAEHEKQMVRVTVYNSMS